MKLDVAATRDAIAASRKEAVDQRFLAFASDASRNVSNRSAYLTRLAFLGTLATQHLRNASGELPEDLVQALALQIELHCRKLL